MSTGRGEATTEKRREENRKRRREIREIFIVYTLNLVLDGGLHVDVTANEHNPRRTAGFFPILLRVTSIPFLYSTKAHAIP